MKTNVQLVIDLSPFTHVHTTDSQYSFVVEINRIYESIARIHNGAQRTAEWWKERVKRKLDSNSVCSIHRSKFTDSCCQCYCHCCILRVTRFLYISLEEHTKKLDSAWRHARGFGKSRLKLSRFPGKEASPPTLRSNHIFVWG